MRRQEPDRAELGYHVTAIPVPGRRPARIGIIPAAGHAKRLQPLDRSKETIEVAGRPILLHLVERMRIAEADRIRVVTRPAKRDVVELSVSHGLEVVRRTPPTSAASVLAGAADIDPDAIVLIGFPDTIWKPVHAFRELVHLVEDGAPLALGCFDSPEPSSGDVVTVDNHGRLVDIAIKPEAPTSTRIWGCFAARRATLEDLDATDELSAFLVRCAATAQIPCRSFGTILDIGTRSGLAAAARIRG